MSQNGRLHRVPQADEEKRKRDDEEFRIRFPKEEKRKEMQQLMGYSTGPFETCKDDFKCNFVCES